MQNIERTCFPPSDLLASSWPSALPQRWGQHRPWKREVGLPRAAVRAGSRPVVARAVACSGERKTVTVSHTLNRQDGQRSLNDTKCSHRLSLWAMAEGSLTPHACDEIELISVRTLSESTPESEQTGLSCMHACMHPWSPTRLLQSLTLKVTC